MAVTKGIREDTSKVLVCEVRSNDPSSPVDGQIWLNTTAGAIKARIGGITKTIYFSGDSLSVDYADIIGTYPPNDATRNNVTFSPSIPAGVPESGDIWVRMSGSDYFTRYFDGDIWTSASTSLKIATGSGTDTSNLDLDTDETRLWYDSGSDRYYLVYCQAKGLTIGEFIYNAGSGDATTPHYINDAGTTLEEYADFTGTDTYVEIRLRKKHHIEEFRHVGHSDMNGDGDYKIQHWASGTWIDNTTGIATRVATWDSWTALDTPITTDKIKIIATTMDTGSTGNFLAELEMRGNNEITKINVSDNPLFNSLRVVGNTISDDLVYLSAHAGSCGAQLLHIHSYAEGYGCSKAIHLCADSGSLAPGEAMCGNITTLIDTDAVNADATNMIMAYCAEVIDESSASKYAFVVNPGFDVGLKVLGATGTDPAYGYEVTSGSVSIRTTEFTSGTVNVSIFDSQNDYILIGSDSTFEVIIVVLETPANVDCLLEYYYSKAGGNWTTLPIQSDSTSGFTNSGIIVFDAPGDWTKDDEAEANGDITDAYYVKIVRTRAAGVAPVPEENSFKIYASTDTGMEVKGDGIIKTSYRVAAPASPENGDIWMESDGLHIYYDGAEKTVAGA